MIKTSNPLLSICIATYKRGQFIQETLVNLLEQSTNEVEIVVFDGNSPDETEKVVTGLAEKHSNLRYVKSVNNGGVDQDFDRAVGYASGQYCWLMTDDDLVQPGTIQKILSQLQKNPSLLILNSSVYDRNFESLLLDRFIKLQDDKSFEGYELEPFLELTGACLSFIGGVVIDRNEWISRERKSYYGSLFIHFGVIFQKPFSRKLIVLAEPLIKIRYGNALWTSRGFEIWMLKWPDLVHSFAQFSQESKNKVCGNNLGRTFKYLAHYRGMGIYSYAEYKIFMKNRLGIFSRFLALIIAFFPQPLMSSLLGIYFGFINKSNKLGFYDLVLSRGLNFVTGWIAEKKIFGSKIWLKKN